MLYLSGCRRRSACCCARYFHFAQEVAVTAAPPVADTGDTAWIIAATALVLFMTLPGLALFYAGLVRAKNVLSILMQCFAITGVVSLLWLAVGYSLTFSDGGAAQPSSADSTRLSCSVSRATRSTAPSPKPCSSCSR